MKTFLEEWLLAAPAILQRELSAQAKLVAGKADPFPATAISATIFVQGEPAGQFTVAAHLPSLHAILIEAGLVGPESDSQRDYELWRGVLKEVTAAAALASGGDEIVLEENRQWPLDLPNVIYELSVGNASMCLALADDVHLREISKGPKEAGPAMNYGNPSKQVHPSIDRLLDVELEASLRFGSCEMSLNQVLELGPGDVLELDRHIADPVDLLVGDKIVARGEVVLVNGSFGLRVLEVAEPRKRLESVRCLF